MPGPSLDASWVYGMNEAVGLGLSFGPDLIFSFGPYSAIYTKAYHPATDGLMIGGSLFLATAYAIGLLLLAKRASTWKLVAYSAVLAGATNLRDPLLFSYPLIVALLVYKYSLPESKERRLLDSNWAIVVAAFVFSPLGLLPIIKNSALIICATVVVLSTPMLAMEKRWSLVGAAILAPVATMIGCWIVSGQAVDALPYFLVNSVPIISGYTEAMALSGNDEEVVSYVVVVTLILYLILKSRIESNRSRVFLLLATAAFLFIAFKAAFVRHDDSHAMIAGASIGMAAIMLAVVIEHALAPIVVCTVARPARIPVFTSAIGS